MRRIASMGLIFLAFAGAPAGAQLQVGASDTVESVLKAQTGKRITLRLRSGQELTGTVRAINARVVQLGTLTGREYFDAVVPLETIDAVIVRVKD
jgi:hypothetical protein